MSGGTGKYMYGGEKQEQKKIRKIWKILGGYKVIKMEMENDKKKYSEIDEWEIFL